MKKKLLGFAVVFFTLFSNSVAFSASIPPDSFADLVDKLTPAVVNISTIQTIDGSEAVLGEMFPNLPEDGQLGDLPELFKKFYENNGNGQLPEKKAASLGSGFIIDPSGYIVTNYHVVDKAEDVKVIFSDDTEVPAKIIGKDSKTDLALIKIETKKDLPFVEWGDSDKSRVGDWVIAIGNPFGLGGSVSAGIISARARDINAGPFDDFIQTDAAINRGNSGGPLFNTDGKIIGVNTAIFSPSGGNVGIGFAVPSVMAKAIITQLRETGYIKRGWLGVKIQTVTDDIAESLGTQANGALVLDVSKDSPADKAGIIVGDVITSFDGKDVPAMRKLPRIVADTAIGKKVPVTIWRKKSKKTLVVTIAELKEDSEDKVEDAGKSEEKKEDSVDATKVILGIGIRNVDSDARKKFNLAKEVNGVVIVKIENESMDRPIRPGDIITSINQEKVVSVDDAEKFAEAAIDSGHKSVLLLVKRGDESMFIAVPVKNKEKK